jgi:Zn finger protein HypA/HybF involved in hydrogenase expression
MSECNSMDSNSKQDPTVLEVHCLQCDGVYPEKAPIVEECPTCGNPDKMRTVYLQN